VESPTPLAADHFERAEQALGTRYKLERVIAANRERVLFAGIDRALNRRVSIRVNFYFDDPTRAWFLREAEALAQLDHPAIRHVYDVAVVGDVAYRVGNWVEGESLLEAAQRGPRLLPMVHTLARDLLSALDHSHAAGILFRRFVPASIVLSHANRGTVTDLRFCSFVVPSIPAGVRPTGLAYMAPEIRDGAVGEPTCDIYTAGAVLYFAVTGEEPTLDPAALRRPSEIRPTCPRTIERIVLRALRPDPERRYLTPAEMLEDFASDAGGYEITTVQPGGSPGRSAPSGRLSEKGLRRALGDDYELLEAIGRGGFGQVFRVRDLHLEREVALKVLDPALTQDTQVVERFRREAQLAAKLSHPNIVDIYDIQTRSGLIWYTMELVRGPNVAQLVEREGPLPVGRVIRMLRESLGALAHAHAQGLVHRDVKPENLLIAPGGAVKITDFGLALALRGAGRFGGATSQSGTPQFASPEQLLGERVDQRSDLYSTSAVACFALLGRPPFSGATPEQILAKQATDQLPELRRARPDVAPELARVLARALASEPDRRYGSATEFLQAINRVTRRSLRQRGVNWLERLLARLADGSP
jgi:serine/threonine-protein kinase